MKTVNPKDKIPFMLKADEAILARRKHIEEESKKKAARPEGEADDTEPMPEDTGSIDMAAEDAPEVLDPNWKPTVFKCTVPTAEEQAHLQDMESAGEMMLTTLDFGLAEIEGFEDAARNPLPLERDTDKRQLFGKKPWKRMHLSRISAPDRQEVANFILGQCKLKRAAAKNF